MPDAEDESGVEAGRPAAAEGLSVSSGEPGSKNSREGARRWDDFGIGASARVGLEVYEQASRRSGRTERLIRGLPAEPFVLFVESEGYAASIRRQIAGLRPDLLEVKWSIRSVGGSGRTRDRIREALHRVPGEAGRRVVMDHTIVFRLYAEAIEEVAKDFAPDPFLEQTGAVMPVSFRGDPDRRGR